MGSIGFSLILAKILMAEVNELKTINKVEFVMRTVEKINNKS